MICIVLYHLKLLVRLVTDLVIMFREEEIRDKELSTIYRMVMNRGKRREGEDKI